MDIRDTTVGNLAILRENLCALLDPRVLQALADFLAATADPQGESSMLARYKWFAARGPDCRYAAAARDFFLKDQSAATAAAIIWLYHNWAKALEPRRHNGRH